MLHLRRTATDAYQSVKAETGTPSRLKMGRHGIVRVYEGERRALRSLQA